LMALPAAKSCNVLCNKDLPSEDEIDIMPNVTFSSGMFITNYPADGARDVELDPTYEWTNNANTLTTTVFGIIGFNDEKVYDGRWISIHFPSE
jgi:hypothetical protein